MDRIYSKCTLSSMMPTKAKPYILILIHLEVSFRAPPSASRPEIYPVCLSLVWDSRG